jgi:large subunit ribosomal protein L4
MPEVAVRLIDGGAGQTVALRDDVFGRPPRAALLHQAVVRQLANARQGTHDTKTRGEVARTTKKVWRQKGTGRARQGSRKGPHWTGGGVAFGPHPRSHRQDMPKKMRRAALCAALSSKAAAGQLVLLEELTMEAPSTKMLARTLATVAPGRSALLVLETPNRVVQLSARNLPYVTALTIDNINIYDVLRHEQLVLTTAAARAIEQRYGRAGGEEQASAAQTPAAAPDQARAEAIAGPAAEDPGAAIEPPDDPSVPSAEMSTADAAADAAGRAEVSTTGAEEE